MIPQLIQREPYDPHWTEVDIKASRGRDFLGVETLSEAILSDLLPGINNQTRRARYYSFWAWALRDFIQDPEVKHNQATLYLWLRKREDALILARFAHECWTSIAGVAQGETMWEDGTKTLYPLDWKSLTSVNGGAYQFYYRGALQEMNITVVRDESPHDDLTKTVGLSLAEAYAQSVVNTDYVKDFLDATRLSRDVLENFAHSGCLCTLDQHEAERQALIELFFRFDSHDSYAIKRLASLSLFLDIIDQSQGQPLNELQFRDVLYFWSYTDQHAYRPADNFLKPAQGWRIFQLRQYFVFNVQSFWSLFLQRIHNQTLSDEDYLTWVLAELDLSKLANEFGLKLSTTDVYALSLKELSEALYKTLPEDALEPGPIAFHTKLNERLLSNPIRDPHTGFDVQVRVGKALLVLLLIYSRCQPWRNEASWVFASDQYGAGRLPIESYLRHIERAFSEGWSIAHWLVWFHHRYLWLQHRRVVLEKLVSRNQDTAKFETVDTPPAEVEGNGRASDTTYFRGLDTDRPKMNAPRFPSALTIMEDLKLIEPTKQSGYKLTLDGAALLEKFRNYAIPDLPDPDVDETEDILTSQFTDSDGDDPT